jgi:hypothetical protein
MCHFMVSEMSLGMGERRRVIGCVCLRDCKFQLMLLGVVLNYVTPSSDSQFYFSYPLQRFSTPSLLWCYCLMELRCVQCLE